MKNFDAEKYWKNKSPKKWVVVLTASGRQATKDTKYVQAKTKEGAVETAKHYTKLKGTLGVVVKLATPADLGAEKVME